MNWSACVDSSGVATLNCFPLLLTSITYWLISFAALAAVALIIVGGIRFITSGGDQKKIDQARKTVLFSILGLILVFLAFFIVNVITKLTGITCYDPSAPLSFSSCQSGSSGGGTW